MIIVKIASVRVIVSVLVVSLIPETMELKLNSSETGNECIGRVDESYETIDVLLQTSEKSPLDDSLLGSNDRTQD